MRHGQDVEVLEPHRLHENIQKAIRAALKKNEAYN
jgi:predicted DNA-binding transcriptional regulator YafY